MLSLSKRLSIHMGSCFLLLVWGLRLWASGCLSCVFNALDHWSENRHVDVSTALVGTEHDSKKVKAGFEEITGEGRAVDPELVWQYGKGEGGPRRSTSAGVEVQMACSRRQGHAAVHCPGPK